MNDSDFEKHLQRQSMRQIPQEWRAEILQNATALAPLSRRSAVKTDRPSFLSTILWPNPKAWAALATVWIAIFALHFDSRDNVPQMAGAFSPHTQQIVMNLKEEQQILAELIGPSGATPEIDRPKRVAPQPHSERRRATAMA
jgi:hypothetical protein